MTIPGVAMPWLVGYYGVFQAAHVVFNVLYLSGLRPIREFPWPPAEGWHRQATAFWTATGLIDTAIALLALYFVVASFGGRCRAPWAGLVSLAMYMSTIFTFNYTVVATGAWARHPVEYVVLNAVSVPLILLFAMLVRDMRTAAYRDYGRELGADGLVATVSSRRSSGSLSPGATERRRSAAKPMYSSWPPQPKEWEKPSVLRNAGRSVGIRQSPRS